MRILLKAGALCLAVGLLGLAMCNAQRDTLPATKAAPIVSQPRDMTAGKLTNIDVSNTVLPASKAGPLVPRPQPQAQQAAPR